MKSKNSATLLTINAYKFQSSIKSFDIARSVVKYGRMLVEALTNCCGSDLTDVGSRSFGIVDLNVITKKAFVNSETDPRGSMERRISKTWTQHNQSRFSSTFPVA